jgi:hypothetical protein
MFSLAITSSVFGLTILLSNLCSMGTEKYSSNASAVSNTLLGMGLLPLSA